MTAAASYIDDRYYDELVRSFAGLAGAREIDDPALRDACARLLAREALLLDENRYGDWLALYAPECLYWVPTTPEAGDPRREITIAFDDRRRLEDRVYRLNNDYAWSQRPRSRTARTVGSVLVYAGKDESSVMLRSSFQLTEYQPPDTRHYAGWYGHRLVRARDDWAIAVKQVRLIDCDRNLRNPSIIL
jgi:3-phenylpropionate/cinnamic acid dioxygenase small subunit